MLATCVLELIQSKADDLVPNVLGYGMFRFTTSVFVGKESRALLFHSFLEAPNLTFAETEKDGSLPDGYLVRKDPFHNV